MNPHRLAFRRTLGFFCLLAILSLHVPRGAAQQRRGKEMATATLNVKVITLDGKEVGVVKLKFKPEGDNDPRHVIKQTLEKWENGLRQFHLRTGVWLITVRKDGYNQVAPRPRPVGVNPGRTSPEEIEMSEALTVRVRPGRNQPRVILVLQRRQDTGVKTEVSSQRADADACRTHRGTPADPPESSLWGHIVKQKPASGSQAVGDSQPVRGASVSLFRISFEDDREDLLGQTKSDGDGCFNLPFTLPKPNADDRYLLTVSRGGYQSHEVFISFATLEKKSKAGQLISLAEMPEEFDDPEGPLIETKEATRRQIFTPRVMEALPVPGLRSFDSFALLAPGVAPPPETSNTRGPGVSPGLGTAGQFAVNGLRPRDNNFTVDGSDNNDEDIGTRRQGFVALAPQPIESLNEFQLITALADARYGRNIGGQANALTKGGTSKFYGSLYGFVTDSRLNARNFFDQTVGNNPASFALERQSDGADVLLDGGPVVSTNPVGGENPLTRTQFGFAVGGPVEKLGAFFFVSLERVKTRASRESHFIVPTVEQRGVFDSGGTGLLLDRPGNPVSAPIFPAAIPGDAIFSLYPFPNNPLGPYGRNTYTTILPADAEGTRFSAKFDRQFGTFDANNSRPLWSFFKGGDTLSGRYNSSRERSIVPVTGGALFSALRPRVRTQNIAFFLDRALTERLSDAIRVSVGLTKLTFREERDPFLTPSSFFPDTPFLLNAPLLLNVTEPTLAQPSFVSASSEQGVERLALLDYVGITQAEQITGALGQVVLPGFSHLGVDVYNLPQTRANTTIQVADTFTYISPDNHIFTSGFEIRKILINSTLDRNFRPQAVFGGLRTSTPSPNFAARLPGGLPLTPRVFSGTTLAAAGVPTGLLQTLAVTPDSSIGIRYTQASFFGQTDWRMSKDLNLNLGARFNYLTQLSTKGNTFERAFDPAELERQGRAAVEDCFRVSGNRAECDRVAKAVIASFPADLKTSFARERFDLDVRVGLAWSLDNRTVVRGGIGTYAGEFPGIVIGQSRNVFPDFLPLNFADFPIQPRQGFSDEVFLFNPANPILRQSDPTLAVAPGTLNTLLPNINAISFLTTRLIAAAGQQRPFSSNVLGLDLVPPQSELQNPYSLQYAVTLERRFGTRYAVSIAYVGTRGIKLLRRSSPRLGLHRSRLLEPGGLTVTTQGGIPFPLFSGAFPRFGGVLLSPQESVPKAQLAIARTFFESSASSTYNSLQVELRRNYARHFQFRTALTYSHAIDDASDFFDTAGAFALPQDSLHRSERASSNFDVRLRSVTHFVRDFPQDLFFSGPTKLGGWQLAGIVTAQTGQPFTVNSAFDINRDGNLTDRLDNTTGLIRGGVAGDPSIQLSLAPGTNPLSLLAADGRDGAVGRNTFRAPSQFNFDLSITKFFNFNERVRLHVRTEIFNLFNRTNFGIPVRILESPAFGKSTYTTTPPRTVQFVFKLLF